MATLNPKLVSETAPSIRMDALDSDSRRTVRARQDRMVVVPESDADGLCTGLYHVFSVNDHYHVLAEEPACNCPDMEWNNPENGCKHSRRVRMMFDETSLPRRDESVVPYARDLRNLRQNLRHRQQKLETDMVLAGLDDDFDAAGEIADDICDVTELLKRL